MKESYFAAVFHLEFYVFTPPPPPFPFSFRLSFLPHFELQRCTCMRFVYFRTAPAALLLHLGLFLHVDRQAASFFSSLCLIHVLLLGLFAVKLSFW